MKTFTVVVFFITAFISNVFAQQCPYYPSLITYYSDKNIGEAKSDQSLRNCSCTVTFYLYEGELYLDSTEVSRYDFGGYRKGHRISGRSKYHSFDKTGDYLDAFVLQNSRCPNENEYQALKQIYLEEKAAFKKVVDKRISDRERENQEFIDRIQKERESRKIQMQKFCKGVPKINQEVIEVVSTTVKVDPQSIRLNRVNQTDDGYCTATFYSPKGVVQAEVDFNSNGAIVSNRSVRFLK